VLLQTLGSGIEVHADFVAQCIDELDQMVVRSQLGQEPSNLEKLAYQLLLDAAYIDPRAEAEQTAKLAQLLDNSSCV
jgi:hypothetical protein